MSILKDIGKGLTKINPILKAGKTYKKGGKYRTDNTLKSITDPLGIFLKKREDPTQIAAKEKKKEKKRLDSVYANAAKHGYQGKPTGMMHGGKVSCRGMGAAERGGRFRKDG